jgi:hypothetical protein
MSTTRAKAIVAAVAMLVTKPAENEIADLATLTKTTARWDKEQEYRLIRYPGVDFSEAGLRFDGQHGHFPADSIMGITIGTDMPADHARIVFEYANQHKPPLQVKSGKRRSAKGGHTK